MTLLEIVTLTPAVTGALYAIVSACTALRHLPRRPAPAPAAHAQAPPVSILKPVYGLEKHLERNLRSVLELDYPHFQVVLAVQRPDDPALPLLESLAREYGPERATLVVNDSEPVFNGKVQNLIGALPHARHDVLLISDSDVRVPRDYLLRMVAAVGEPGVGAACTLFRGADAEHWYERLEQLSFNAEFVANVVFAEFAGGEEFCTGCSLIIRRDTLEQIGGLEPLLEYLVEDYELGRRVRSLGRRVKVLPMFVDTTVDLARARDWWNHQVYWEQNTRWVNPTGFFLTLFIQPVPFALAFAAIRGFDPAGIAVLAAVAATRILTRLAIFRHVGDRETARMLAWLPVRDLGGFGAWIAAICKRSFVWRGLTFDLVSGGRIVPRRPSASA